MKIWNITNVVIFASHPTAKIRYSLCHTILISLLISIQCVSVIRLLGLKSNDLLNTGT